jgi:regulation of enolase protein 1 (concanavalin A-like superfamily)
VAGPATNYFVDPIGVMMDANGPLVLTPLDGPFQLSCRVHTALAAQFDAIGMFVYRDDNVWGKFAFERSPQLSDMIVSVITSGVSDDSNGPELEPGTKPYMRISRVQDTYVFHDSLDGKFWRMRRLFTLGDVSAHRVGFFIQSPTGEGLEGEISDFTLTDRVLAEFRDGS